MIQKARFQKDGSHETYKKPFCIEKYSEYLHGVDAANHLATTYRYKHRKMKWYMNMFYYLLEVSIVNSYLVYKREMVVSNIKKILNSEDFREHLVELWQMKTSVF